MTISKTKTKKQVGGAALKGPNKKATVLLTKQFPDIQYDSNQRWPGGCTARFTYDFSVDGGATGDITPSKSVTIPANAIITDVFVDVLTSVTSAGSATVAVKAQNSADLCAATAKASLTAGTVIPGAPNSGTEAPIKLTADATPVITVGTAALTAGKLNVYVKYIFPEA